MADLYWVGDVDTNFTNPDNYRTSYGGTSVPASIAVSDVVYFTDMGEADCVLNVVGTTTIEGLIWEDHYETETIGAGSDTLNINSPNRFAYNFQLDSNLSTKRVELNGPITSSTTGARIEFNSTPQLDANRKYITLGENASISGDVELYFNPTAGTEFYLDNGQYGQVVLVNGTLRPQYITPTFEGHDKIEIEHIDIRSTMTIEPASPMGRRDREVYFLFYGSPDPFVCDAASVDFGRATFAIAGAQGGTPTEIPMNHALNYGLTNDFSIKYGALRIYAPQATNNPYRAEISSGLTLAVNHLIVDAGASIKGGENCTIECVSLPIIKGSLGDFMQVNDGLYRTSANAILSDPLQTYRYGGTGLTSLGTSGQVLATKSTLDGMEWITVSGGGGSGTVTSVAATVPTGFAISGSPITTSGTLAISYATGYSLPTDAKQTQWDTAYGWGDHASAGYLTSFTETDPIFVAHPSYLITAPQITNWDTAFAWGDHSAAGYLETTGGTMTGEIEATTITLNTVPADPATDDKVRLGESGTTSNMLRIQTNAGYLDIGPNNSGYAHLMTNTSRFYLNKPLFVDGGGQVFAYNDGLKLGTGTSAGGGTVAINIADGSTNVEVVGTLRQGAVASAVLVADGSGDIVGASVLQDIAYLSTGQAETDVFTPTISGPAWAGAPPTTIQEAIERIANAISNPAYMIGTPIP